MKTNNVREAIYAQINEERDRQDVKFGEANKSNTLAEWGCITGEEYGEVLMEVNDIKHKGIPADNLRVELIQLAAVTIAWIESLDKQTNSEVVAEGKPFGYKVVCDDNGTIHSYERTV